MSVFNGYLQSRDDRQREEKLQQIWGTASNDPARRLLMFDAWIRRQLSARLDWTWANGQEVRRIEQCRLYLERLVLELWRRGWMLDGQRLAAHLIGVLDRIGKYQRAGKVAEFWPYFRATVDRYVGANAEEIQAEAMSAGAHIGQVLGALGVRRTASGQPLPELLARRRGEIADAKEETLRLKQSRLRRLQARGKAAAEQQQLF